MKKLKNRTILMLIFVMSISLHAQTAKYKVIKKNVKINATIKSPTGKAYFFTSTKYYRQNLNTDKLEKKAEIKGNFKGLTTNFDAALLHTNGKGYFFKENKYYRYNFYAQKVDKIGVIGKDGWRDVPSNLDAAVVHSNGKAYFFKGSKYYRYNSALHKVDKIAQISKNWKGVPNNVEAALLHTNGKIYFFKDNKYYRYSITARKVDKIGTIGKDGWKGLSFVRRIRVPVGSTSNTTTTENNIRLKVTLTRVKSIQARDSDDIADFHVEQYIDYKTLGNVKEVTSRNIRKYSKGLVYDYGDYDDWKEIDYDKIKQKENTILYSNNNSFHIREGDEKFYINNSLFFEITPQEIKDKRSEFKIHTDLAEIDGDNWLFENVLRLFAESDIKTIARHHFINVNIYEVLDYLLHPNASKYGKSYFKGGRAGNMHEYGAYGDVMWFKKGTNNSLIGHLEFGDNKKETYVRFYYRFELIP